jgi:4-aminobutyrate aminotransferase/(S)-3-amino-2-methylpropionate transaminase
MVRTAIPGPKSLQLIAELSAVQDSRSITFHADYTKSSGNMIVDADGNKLLDLFCQIGT